MCATAQNASLSVLDPLYFAFSDDPYPAYARLRSECPVKWESIGDNGAWIVSRYADCMAVLRNPRMGAMRSTGQAASKSSKLGDRAAAALFENLFSFHDPPGHTWLRNLVSKIFSPRAIDKLRPRVHAIVEELLRLVETRGEMDLMADFALTVPVLVISEMLGVPHSDRKHFRRWTPELSRIFEPSLQSPDELERCNRATAELVTYFEDLLAARRRNPRDDILSALILAEHNGQRLRGAELIAMAIQLLNAGYQSTMGLIGNGALALLEHPDQMARLRSNPSLVGSAVEECLRYDSTVQRAGRFAHCDIVLNGSRIEQGQVVWTLIGSANRDPDAFDYPEHFDIARTGPPHLAFGLGAHGCLGAHLVRMETEIALEGLIRHLPRLQLSGERIVYRPSFLFRRPAALPVSF